MVSSVDMGKWNLASWTLMQAQEKVGLIKANKEGYIQSIDATQWKDSVLDRVQEAVGGVDE